MRDSGKGGVPKNIQGFGINVVLHRVGAEQANNFQIAKLYQMLPCPQSVLRDCRRTPTVVSRMPPALVFQFFPPLLTGIPQFWRHTWR